MKAKGAARLPPAAADLQVNCCKHPACKHFAARPDPASTAIPPPRHGIGPSAFYDGKYMISSLGDKSLECLSCGEKSPLKSNAAVQEEVARLRQRGEGATAPAEAASQSAGCPKQGCRNHGLPDGLEVGPLRPRKRYVRHGGGTGAPGRLRCRSCGSTWREEPMPRGRRRRPLSAPERQLLQGLVAHTPYIRLAQLLRLPASRLHQLIGRFEEETLKAQAELEQGLPAALRGRTLTLSTDRQVYPVNWSERTDRRPVLLHSVVTADQGTGYVLAAHVNYDPLVDPRELALAAKLSGDRRKDPAYRPQARLRLPGELAAAEGAPPLAVVGATSPVSSAHRYAQAAVREDVEQPESGGRAPTRGAVVREDVTLYAHFQLLREQIGLARHVTHCFEQESAMRAACLTAFADRVRGGRCEAFYVRIDKGFTAEKKQRVASASRKRLEAVQVQYGCDGLEARRILVRQALSEQRLEERGPWRDRWLVHPCPTAFEPAKEICRLTRQAGEGQEEDNPAAVHGFTFASLHAVDRFFLNVRYKVNALDRHRQTAAFGRAWNVYHPYNPARVPALLAIYRLWHNWGLVAKDGTTPAMRVGLAVRPLDQDIVLDHGLAAAVRAVRAESSAPSSPQAKAADKEPPPPQPRTDTSWEMGMGM